MNKPRASDLVAFPRNQLSDADRARLTEAGIVFVELDDPKAVHRIKATTELVQSCIDGDDIVRAAIRAMAEGGFESVSHHFVKMLNQALLAQQGPAK